MATYKGLLLSTAFLPPIEYFVFMEAFGNVVIEQYENFNKQSYRNRAYVAGANGRLCLSVPVNRWNTGDAPILGIQISDHEDWRSIHWRSIESAYNASPFFLYYKDVLENIIMDRSIQNLFELNKLLMESLLNETGLGCHIQYSKAYEKEVEGMLDLRMKIHPKKPLNVIMEEFFGTAGSPYIQVFSEKHGFMPDLSIIDLLFNLGPESGDYIQRLAQNMKP